MKSNTSITTKKIELSESMTISINKVFENFNKYNLEIISEKAVVSKNKRHEIKIELILELKGKHTIIIESVDKDFYEALADASDRVEKALRRLSDKIKDHRKNISLKNIEPDEPTLHLEVEKTIDEEIEDLVQMEMKLVKPMDIEDAIKTLRGNKNIQFFVFNDRSGNMRTIYKRSDGKIGIY